MSKFDRVALAILSAAAVLAGAVALLDSRWALRFKWKCHSALWTLRKAAKKLSVIDIT